MLKKTMLVATSVAMLAVTGPISHAAPAALVHAGCGFESIAEETVTGDTYTGAVYGYAVFADHGTHTLRCFITVDGVDQGGVSASGTVFVAGAGTVAYNAVEDETVELCTEIDGTLVSCGSATGPQIPPQEVIDLLDTVFATLYGVYTPIEWQLDPVICTLLKAAAPGIPGVVDITADGDTTVAVIGPLYDCPPHGDLFPPA
jgi:hypothetical protein